MHDIWEQLNDPHYTSPAAHLHQMATAFECGGDGPDGDCWGPGPPPEFRMPPPPRPPFLQQLSDDRCSEDPLPEIEMCAAMPAMLDPSYHISPSQTSTLIFVFSVLLLFTICLSSFVVWKHKRKVPGFMQCKTPTHPHRAASGGGAAGSGSSRHQSPSLSSPDSRSLAAAVGAALYEDPDLHILGHQQTTLRQQMLGAQHSNFLHNEVLLPKSIHYPSGYPMPHSPPIFVCSSPGPDPYRSHDNVYEELDQQQQLQQNTEATTRRNSEADVPQDCVVDDGDAFAGDELSCAGLDGNYHKVQSQHLYQQPHPVQSISTIYHERRSADILLDRSASERNSLLSTSTSSSTSAQRGCGLFGGNRQPRQQSGASNNQRQHQTLQAQKVRSSRHPQQQQQSFAAPPPSYDVIQQMATQHPHIHQPAQYSRTFDHRASPRFYRHPANNSAHILNAAPYNYQRYVQPQQQQQQPQFHHLPVGSFAASLQHDVEVKRRNQLNAHLTSSAAIATIYQTTDPQLDCAQHPHQPQPQQQNYYHQQPTRSRTNPRPTDRRRQQAANVYAVQPSAPAYGTYRDPSMLAQRIGTPSSAIRGSQYPSYISPAEFSTFRQATDAAHGSATTSAPPPPPPTAATATTSASQYCLNPITSRDSSFGSDSGYSHHTQSSNHHIAGLLQAAELAEGGSHQLSAPVPAPPSAHITEQVTDTRS